MENQRLLILTNHLPKEQTIQISSIVKSIEQTTHINQIDLLHIKPYVAAHCFALPSMVTFLEQCHQQAEESLNFWGELLDVSIQHQWTSNGHIRQEASLFSRRFQCDYILSSHQLKHHFTPRFSLSGKQPATLVRPFGNLDFYSTETKSQVQHWQHPIAQSI